MILTLSRPSRPSCPMTLNESSIQNQHYLFKKCYKTSAYWTQFPINLALRRVILPGNAPLRATLIHRINGIDLNIFHNWTRTNLLLLCNKKTLKSVNIVNQRVIFKMEFQKILRISSESIPNHSLARNTILWTIYNFGIFNLIIWEIRLLSSTIAV